MANDTTLRTFEIPLTTNPEWIEEQRSGTIEGRPIGHAQVSIQVTNRFIRYVAPFMNQAEPEIPLFDMKIVVCVGQEDPAITQLREAGRMRRENYRKTVEEANALTEEIDRMEEENVRHEQYLRSINPFFDQYRGVVQEVETLRSVERTEGILELINEKTAFLERHEADVERVVNASPYPHSEEVCQHKTRQRNKKRLFLEFKKTQTAYPSTSDLDRYLQSMEIDIRNGQHWLFKKVQNAAAIHRIAERYARLPETGVQQKIEIPWRVLEAMFGQTRTVGDWCALLPGTKNIISAKESTRSTLLLLNEKEGIVLLLPYWICEQILYNMDLIRASGKVHEMIVETTPHASHRELKPEDQAGGRATPELTAGSLDTEGTEELELEEESSDSASQNPAAPATRAAAML